MVEVVLEGLSKTYPGGVEAVRALSLRVVPGERLVLLGPSGCGKTTTLRLIAGLETPTRGEVWIGGKRAEGTPPHRRGVAFVFQRPALYPHWTIAENLAFGLGKRPFLASLFRRWAGNSERVEEVARWLRLGDVLGRRPGELSGGQQQRVALGRALARGSLLWLLDEPLSNLDAPLRREMRWELHLLHGRVRATIIYVTHDAEEGMTLGDRVAVLHRGVLEQVDEPEGLYHRPASRFVATFLGWPPLGILDGDLEEADGRFWLAGPPERLPVPAPVAGPWKGALGAEGRRVTVGIRPDGVRLPADGAGEVRASEVVLTMEVRVSEGHGPGRLVTLQSGPWTVSARPGPHAPRAGTRIPVALDLGRAHLFDGQTGKALYHPPAEPKVGEGITTLGWVFQGRTDLHEG